MPTTSPTTLLLLLSLLPLWSRIAHLGVTPKSGNRRKERRKDCKSRVAFIFIPSEETFSTSKNGLERGREKEREREEKCLLLLWHQRERESTVV